MEKRRFLIFVYIFVLGFIFCANLFAQEAPILSEKEDPASTSASAIACSSDSDCRSQVAPDKDLEAECVNPGQPESKCEFLPKVKVLVTVITSKHCVTCNPGSFLNKLQRFLGDVEAKFADQTNSQEIIEKSGLNVLPIYILNKEVKNHKNFNSIAKYVTEKDFGFLVDPRFAGVALFADRKLIPGKLDLFISPLDKNLAAILNNLRDLKPVVHFLAYNNGDRIETRLGTEEAEENLRGICVDKYYKDQLFDYLICRAQNKGSAWWDDCLKGASSQKIKKCATGEQGKLLLVDNIKLDEELKIMYGPVLLLNNQSIFVVTPELTGKEIKKIQEMDK